MHKHDLSLDGKEKAKEYVETQIYLEIENLLVPIRQLVSQSLDLSCGWIQFGI